MRKLLYLLIVLHSIFIQNSRSQGEISLLVDPDTNIFFIGEQVNINLTIKHPRNVSMVFPDLTKNIDPKLEVLNSSTIDTSVVESLYYKLTQQFTITSFDTGISIIPPLPFIIDFGEGKRKDTLFTRQEYMLVLSMPLDTTNNIFDIKPQYPMNFTFYELVTSPYFYYSVAGILLAVLIYFLYQYFKPEEKKIEKPEPKIPAHVIALQELDELKSEKLWQQNKTKEYYSKLTDIIRKYIELRFNVRALEQTTTEIITSFQHNKLIDQTLMEHLRGLLSLADLVKFAKGSALPDENENNMDSAYDFVRKTKQTQIYSNPLSENENKYGVEPLKNKDNDA